MDAISSIYIYAETAVLYIESFEAKYGMPLDKDTSRITDLSTFEYVLLGVSIVITILAIREIKRKVATGKWTDVSRERVDSFQNKYDVTLSTSTVLIIWLGILVAFAAYAVWFLFPAAGIEW